MHFDIAIQQTVDFVKDNLPIKGGKILEVGCGDGVLAQALAKEEYQIRAIDKSPEAVAKALANGITAEVADILDYETEERFDAVLFCQSLHHINPLASVFTKVKKITNEKGKLLVEDFALEEMDEKSAEWFYDLRGVIASLTGEEFFSSEPGMGALDRWKKEHHHEPALHTGKKIVGEMERYFGTIYAQKAPYLYRYFGENQTSLTNIATAKRKVFDWETKLIESNLVKPIGLRIASKKYFSYLR